MATRIPSVVQVNFVLTLTKTAAVLIAVPRCVKGLIYRVVVLELIRSDRLLTRRVVLAPIAPEGVPRV